MAIKGHCKELLGSLSDYISGEAAEMLCQEIKAHLVECENCRVMVDTLQKTIVLCRSTEADELPADVRSRLYHKLDLSDFLLE